MKARGGGAAGEGGEAEHEVFELVWGDILVAEEDDAAGGDCVCEVAEELIVGFEKVADLEGGKFAADGGGWVVVRVLLEGSRVGERFGELWSGYVMATKDGGVGLRRR